MRGERRKQRKHKAGLDFYFTMGGMDAVKVATGKFSVHANSARNTRGPAAYCLAWQRCSGLSVRQAFGSSPILEQSFLSFYGWEAKHDRVVDSMTRQPSPFLTFVVWSIILFCWKGWTSSEAGSMVNVIGY